jgi:hypothetical protein
MAAAEEIECGRHVRPGPAKPGRRDGRRGWDRHPPRRASLPAWLFDAATGGLVEWSEFDAEAGRWGIEVRGLSREDLRALIESSTRKIPTTEHRRLHQKASAFVWWGRRGGLRTLALYGAGRTSRCSPASDGGTSH